MPQRTRVPKAPTGVLPHSDGSRRAPVASAMIRSILGHPVVRRVRDAAITLLGVAVTVFVVLRAIPGDQISAGLGTEAAALTPGQREALVDYYGIDKPLVGQFFSWLGNVFTGNLGVLVTLAHLRRRHDPRLAAGHGRARRDVDPARAAHRDPARHVVGVEAELAAGRRRSGGRARRALDPGVPAGDAARDRARQVVPVQPERQGVRHAVRGPVAEPPADLPARRRARVRDRRADHAHDADVGARGPLERLHPHGPRQGRPGPAGRGPPRAAQRARCRS